MYNIQKIIPKEWQRKKIGEIIVENIKSSIKVRDAVSLGVYPFFTNGENVLKHSNFIVDGENIFMNTGGIAGAKFYNGKASYSADTYSFKAKDNTKYLYYFLLNKIDKINKNYFSGSGLKHLQKDDFKKYEFDFPEIREQQKIAGILGAVDEDIARTQAVIETTEKLKQGLMQQLFTRGVGHTKFKETKIGQIPKEWEVVAIKDAPIKLIDGDRGVNYPGLSDFTSGGYCLFLNNKNIKNDQFVFSDIQFISREKDEKLRKGKLQRLDVVLTTRGTVGNVAFYDKSVTFENIRINSGMILLRAFDGIEPIYLYHLMKSFLMKRKYKEIVSGSAQPQLPIKILDKIFIPIPPEDEQQKVAEILSAVDEKISVNKKLKEKLTSLKKGLMQDLLSGKVRVNI